MQSLQLAYHWFQHRDLTGIASSTHKLFAILPCWYSESHTGKVDCQRALSLFLLRHPAYNSIAVMTLTESEKSSSRASKVRKASNRSRPKSMRMSVSIRICWFIPYFTRFQRDFRILRTHSVLSFISSLSFQIPLNELSDIGLRGFFPTLLRLTYLS